MTMVVDMPEPVITAGAISTTTATSTFSVGLATLFVGWFGSAGAEVMMIILAAVTGCSIGLSGQKKSYGESIIFTVKGVLVSVVLAQIISMVTVHYIPMLNSPYLPSVVAFILGFSVDKLPSIINGLLGILVTGLISMFNKLVVRLILLLPMLSAVFNLNMLLANGYTSTTLVVVRELSTLILYILVALLLRGNRLLTNIDTICERKSPKCFK